MDPQELRQAIRSCFSAKGAEVFLSLKVQPRSSRLGPLSPQEGMLRWGVKSAPVDGAANEELILVVAKFFGLSRRQVELRSGEKSRRKVLSLGSLAPENAIQMLIDFLGGR